MVSKYNYNDIKCEENVKLLGVTIDFLQLNFNVHVSNICKGASNQLNVLNGLTNTCADLEN